MKRSWAVCVLAALAIAGGMAAMADEANPAPAPVPAAAPSPGTIVPVIVAIHHAKATYVASYLQVAIDFAEAAGTNQVLKGKSKALPDDRSKQIILLTAKENMPFLGRIIQALDVPADEPPAQPSAPPPSGAAEKKDAPRP